MNDDDGQPEPTASNAADYTDTVRSELRALRHQLDELNRRLARIEDHLRLNGAL